MQLFIRSVDLIARKTASIGKIPLFAQCAVALLVSSTKYCGRDEQMGDNSGMRDRNQH